MRHEPDMQKQLTRELDGNDVVTWRRDRLTDAGFSQDLATRVADDRRYDLHALIELVESGCPTELAVRILAPLEAGAE